MPWRYREWFGKAIAAFLLWIVSKMLQARLGRVHDKYNEIVVHTGSDQKTTVESIVAAQFGLRTAYELMQASNIAILKIWSIMCSKARKVHILFHLNCNFKMSIRRFSYTGTFTQLLYCCCVPCFELQTLLTWAMELLYLQHADMTMVAMSVSAIIFALIPLKYIIMAITLYYFLMTSKLGKYIGNEQGNRRLKEWWDSIPVIPVHIEDKAPQRLT